MKRTTVRKPVTIEGTGLHRGKPVSLKLMPYEDGIVYSSRGVLVPARPENVVDSRLNTTLGSGTVTISTVEHLMAALCGLGITDCLIELDGNETPAMDGSALSFYTAIEEVGLNVMEDDLPDIIIDHRLRVEKGDSFIEVEPGEFSISYTIDFKDVAIGRQTVTYSGDDFRKEIAPARTFGRLEDVETMRSMGLSLGGGLHNAVVVDGERILNPEGLRFPDEFARHKVLDMLGDLWMLGSGVKGRFTAYKANHFLHMEMARRIARGD